MSERRLQSHLETHFSTFGQQYVSANRRYVETYTTFSFCRVRFQFCVAHHITQRSCSEKKKKKKCFGLPQTCQKLQFSVRTNSNVTCSKALLKISSGVFVTHLEMQSWTVVTGLAVPLHLLSGEATLSNWVKESVVVFVLSSKSVREASI